MFALPLAFERPVMVRRGGPCRRSSYQPRPSVAFFDHALAALDDVHGLRLAVPVVEDKITLDVTEHDAELVIDADIPSHFTKDEVSVTLDAPRRILSITAVTKQDDDEPPAETEEAAGETTAWENVNATEATEAAAEKDAAATSEKKDAAKGAPAKALLRERRQWHQARRVTRSIRLPADVDADSAAASFEDHTLQLRLPKKNPVHTIAIE